MSPGSRVIIHTAATALPMTLAPFSGRVGVLVEWEVDESGKYPAVAIVRIGGKDICIAAGHLSPERTK